MRSLVFLFLVAMLPSFAGWADTGAGQIDSVATNLANDPESEQLRVVGVPSSLRCSAARRRGRIGASGGHRGGA